MVTRKGVDDTRVRFGFPEAVLSSFQFLVKELGFICVRQEATIVRFESSNVFVTVYHGRSSYELGVEIGQLRKNTDIPEFGFTLGEIISLTDPKLGLAYRPYQITRPELVTGFVRQVAELVKKYSLSALVGEPSWFDKLSNLRVETSNQYIKQMELNSVRSEVEVAWREKNYKQVVELYGSVEGDLTLSESKKLEYARRKLRETAS